ERRVRHRQGAALAVGSKPHVDAENEAFRRDLVQRADDAAAKPLEELPRRQCARSIRLAVFRIDEDEIDVRRYVELASAELAHADDDEALCRSGLVARLPETGDELAVVQR